MGQFDGIVTGRHLKRIKEGLTQFRGKEIRYGALDGVDLVTISAR